MESSITEIATVISTVGFPIVACCGLFYLYNKTIQDITAAITKINATLELIVKNMDDK